MDITLIPQAETKYNKKIHRSFLTDGGIVKLTDCSLVLLHKAGLRPLCLMTDNKNTFLIQPEHKKMDKPDLILYSDQEAAGEQSAKVIQEQLKTCDCSTEIRSVNFSSINKTNNFKVLKNMLTKHAKQLEREGHHHIVVVASPEYLNKIASCMNETGLNQAYNIPIYSFSEGKEIVDKNLIKNFYITRDLLDNHLIREMEQGEIKELTPFKNKCHHPFEWYQIRKKLHFPE